MTDYVLVVLHKLSDTFGYYDVGTGEKLLEKETNHFPHELCLSPKRDKLYITEYGVRGVETEGQGDNRIAVFDVKTQDRVSTISTGEYNRPHGIVSHPNGKLFVTSEPTKHLLIFDLQAEELLHAVYTDQECSHMCNVSPDGKTAYTANVFSNSLTAIDVETGKVLHHIPVLERPEGMVFSPDGQLIYVVNRESAIVAVVDAEKAEMVGEIATQPGPVRIVITPDGKRLAFPLFHSDAVQVADTETLEVTYTIEVGKQPAGTCMSRDGKLVFMSCEVENAVYVFSMEDNKVLNVIQTTNGPDSMVCLDGHELN